MFDQIGDIHGHAGALKRLLAKLGYSPEQRVYKHPDRRVIFLGDFIDRGPMIRKTPEIVRLVFNSGPALAVMGKHERSALT